MNNLKYLLIINPYIKLIIHIIVIVIWYIILKQYPISAMEQPNDIVNDIMTAKQNDNQNELTRLLEQIRNIRNADMINNINNRLQQLEIQEGIMIEEIQINNHNLTIANAGTPQNENQSWYRIIVPLSIFVTITASIYILYRNIDTIRDFLFDVTNHSIEYMDTAVRLSVRVSRMAQNPQLRDMVIQIVNNELQNNLAYAA